MLPLDPVKHALEALKNKIIHRVVVSQRRFSKPLSHHTMAGHQYVASSDRLNMPTIRILTWSRSTEVEVQNCSIQVRLRISTIVF